MRKIISFLLLILAISYLTAQTAFNFESGVVPSQWKSENGTLSLCGEHYKEGDYSLCWKTNGKSVLSITPSNYQATVANSFNFQLYSSMSTNDTLKVEFYNEEKLVRSMNLCMNFKGWRTICRAYSEFSNRTESLVTKIKIILSPVDIKASRSICFDDVNFSSKTPRDKFLGTQWKNDFKDFSDKEYAKSMLESYSSPLDIEIVKPTAAEISVLKSLKRMSSFKLSPRVGSAKEIAAAISYVESLHIERNPDGSVHGVPLDLKPGKVTEEMMTTLSRHLEVLAADGSSSDLFSDLLDHLLDQGFAEGIEYFQHPWSYTGSRAIPPALLNVLPICTKVQKEEVLKLCKWILLFDDFYLPKDQYLPKLNSDRIHLFCPYFIQIILNESNDATSVRELKAFKRYLDRSAAYVPGDKDFLKSDGTGFHHMTPYANYMIAYREFAQYMYCLKGTPFKVEKESYEHLKKAVISQFMMGSFDASKGSYLPISLCGRKPMELALTLNSTLFDNLMDVGEDLYGTQDNELASAYNYIYQSKKYKVSTQANLCGFYAFNYGNLGVYRQGNWVASMRSPTVNTKTSEIFPNTNRFGRYQGHGTLEILYPGLMASGYPTDKTWGGWDWNVVPGATTVHYTNWLEMMPCKNTSVRYDQKAKSKNFAGALSWNDIGLFACDFDQGDTWGPHLGFVPTNLVFKKTVLAIDKLLIDVGTNIGSSGDYSTTMNTATNLFQSVISNSTKILEVNGDPISTNYSTSLNTNTVNTILSPTGTGYILPKGNDAIKVFYGLQTTPKQDGSDVSNPISSLTIAKAYIVHGVKPTDKNYQFVVVPGTTARSLTAIASDVNTGGTYQLVSADSTMHVIHYKPKNLMAYTFFKEVNNVNDAAFHLLQGISSEALVMERKSATNSSAYDFAISNPNMRPVDDYVYGWLPTATTSILTLRGRWYIKTSTSSVSMVSSTDLETKIQIMLNEGQPEYFTIDASK